MKVMMQKEEERKKKGVFRVSPSLFRKSPHRNRTCEYGILFGLGKHSLVEQDSSAPLYM